MNQTNVILPEGISIPDGATLSKQNEGYWRLYFNDDSSPQRTIFLHRYIYQNFHGPIPEGYVIHHRNGIPDDNSMENLVEMSRKEHSRLHRLSKMETSQNSPHSMPLAENNITRPMKDAEMLGQVATIWRLKPLYSHERR